jgi:hypothetical protein
MRRVPSTLIARDSSSPSVNETDAAQCTIALTRSASQVRREGSRPSPGRATSAATATARRDHGSALPSNDAMARRSRRPASSSLSARTTA